MSSANSSDRTSHIQSSIVLSSLLFAAPPINTILLQSNPLPSGYYTLNAVMARSVTTVTRVDIRVRVGPLFTTNRYNPFIIQLFGISPHSVNLGGAIYVGAGDRIDIITSLATVGNISAVLIINRTSL